MKYIDIIKNGLVKENPTFVLFLGMCPTLATTTSAINGLSMGLATMAVLICTNFVISLIKNLPPNKVHIPVYIVVIAAFVTVLQMLMSAYAPQSINDALGIYIPLIVVNCIILGRAESFACKNTPLASVFDGIGIGLGFTVGLRTRTAWSWLSLRSSAPSRNLQHSVVCPSSRCLPHLGLSGGYYQQV